MILAQTAPFIRRPAIVPSSLFDQQPEGWTVVREMNNPPSIPAAGSHATLAYIEGSPNPTGGGTTARVTSGYGDSPPAGGPAVAESILPEGPHTGYGQGRLSYDLASLNADRIYIATIDKLASDWPWSDNSNKWGQMNWGASTPTEERMLLAFRSREIGSPGYDANRDNLHVLGAMDNAGDGGFSSPNLYSTTDLVIGSQPVTRGTWVVRQMLWERNSGVGDGVFKQWIDGVQCHDENELDYPDGGTGIARRFYIEHVNNGIDSVTPNEGRRWVGYMRVAVPA